MSEPMLWSDAQAPPVRTARTFAPASAFATQAATSVRLERAVILTAACRRGVAAFSLILLGPRRYFPEAARRTDG